MIVIIDENMGFVKPMSKYIFAQYEERFRDVGTFEIKAQMEDENLFLLDRNKKYYVLFDFKVFGKITDISKDSDSEYDKVIEIKGSLSPYLFTKRVIRGILNFTGQTYKYIETLVKTYITDMATTDPRYMNISIVFDNEERLKQVCSTIERQVTGGYLWDEMSEYLEKDRLGIEFYPVMGTAQANGSNITSWVLKISSGRDCTMGNTQQNEAILLSQTWNNINKTSYEINLKKQSDVAYLAGEGEGADRKWYEVSRNDTVKQNTGFNRNELWVDARDVQSMKEDGSSLTDEEYQQKITERANEKLEENNISEVYESTMNKVDKRYTYRENIFLGDIVTVIDAELNNIQLEAQIVGATTSYEGTTKTVDLSLAYGAIEDSRTINDRLEQTKVSIEAMNVAVNYLENAVHILKATDIGFDSSETVIKASNVQNMLQLVDSAVNELNQNMNTTVITATGITCNKGTITAGGYTKIGSLVVIAVRISLSETVNRGDSIIINGFPRSASSGLNYIPINVNTPVANGYMSPYGTITIVADGQAANGTALIVGGCYVSAMNL